MMDLIKLILLLFVSLIILIIGIFYWKIYLFGLHCFMIGLGTTIISIFGIICNLIGCWEEME